MLKLSKDAFIRAKNYVMLNARNLDKLMFEYYFENGSATKVLYELKNYQNEDGGFGNSIEPDCRFKVSSPIATTVGFHYLKGLNVSTDNEIVQKGIQYLLNSFNNEKLMWHAILPEFKDAPHAPWWDYNEENVRSWYEGWGNPSAEIVGYLHKYSSLVPVDFLNMVTELAIAKLNARVDSLTMHELMCYLRMFDELPEVEKNVVFENLKKSVINVVERNPDEWCNYVAEPYKLITSSNSPFIHLIEKELQLNLDYVVRKQDEDGGWHPNWSWGQYEDAWQYAKKEWTGHMTVNMLKMLTNFDLCDQN